MQHNRWLQWKIDHGLAFRGRSTGNPLQPTTVLARLAGIFIKPVPSSTIPGERVFTQDVGGTVGPVGNLNGE